MVDMEEVDQVIMEATVISSCNYRQVNILA